MTYKIYKKINNMFYSFWQPFLLVPTFLTDFRKKVLDPNISIYKHESDNLRNFCLSVGIMSVFVVCSASTAYTGLCKGLKYLLKVRYIILDSSNVVGFLIFKTFFWAGWKHCPMSGNSITKMNAICIWYHIASPNFHRTCV